MVTASDKVKVEDYASTSAVAWCPGCGNFGILRAMKKALVELQLRPHQVLMVSGIGQAGKFPHYLQCNVLNELHGRPIPAATAAKLVNPELTVIAVSGDGDAYGEGGNHFVHAMNRNVDMTYMVHNNQVYALTRGQACPTTDLGFTTKMNPNGAWVSLRPLALAVACDCSFVARGFCRRWRTSGHDHTDGRQTQRVCPRGGAAAMPHFQPQEHSPVVFTARVQAGRSQGLRPEGQDRRLQQGAGMGRPNTDRA